MWNRYQPYRGGIRFFPHIFPIAFPLIFPFGIGLAAWLFHLLMPLIGLLLLVALVFFIIRTITLGSPGAAWNSMKSTGSQWQQRFTSQNQQAPYYRPSASAGQEQASQQYGQGYTPEQPYYQPSPSAGQEQPYYRPSSPAGQEQPRTQYPEQMPPMQQ